MFHIPYKLGHGHRIGDCCGSSLIAPNRPFEMTLGIIVGEGVRQFTPTNRDTFVVVETKNGPLSIATRGAPVKKEK